MEHQISRAPKADSRRSALQRRQASNTIHPVQGAFLQLQSQIGNRAVASLLQSQIQMQTVDHEPSAQRQPTRDQEEESTKQLTAATLQRQVIPEEEEPLQMRAGLVSALQRQQPEEEEVLQGKATSSETPRKPGVGGAVPATGMPGPLRMGLEALSGEDLSAVRVHYNATRPAQLNALAYTQGQEIHVAPGQEKHLPHEGWHAVQQIQGRVRPTIQGPGVGINDDKALEREADAMGAKAQQLMTVTRGSSSRRNSAGSSIVQRQEPAAPVTPGQLINQYTSWIGSLDEEGLGRNLARRQPGQADLAIGVLNQLSSGDRDDVSYEIASAAIGKLSIVDDNLRIRMVRELVGGFVSDAEEGAIANIWISFQPRLPQVAESNRELWKKSLWESDQLVEYLKPFNHAFIWDVIDLARAYLAENKRAVIVEGARFGLQLGAEEPGEPIQEQEGYLEDILAIAAKVRLLQKDQDELRRIKVGYKVTYKTMRGDVFEWETPVTFDPESPPRSGPKGTESPPIPTWAEVNDQYMRLGAVISGFANLYPSIYTLIQQDKLEELTQQGEAAKAREVIAGSLRKTLEKINESDEKITSGDISYYDLVPIQTQLFGGVPNPLAIPYRYPWNQPFYMDIAKDDLEGHKAREFWVKLGLSLVAAAALIAAPFTGGATLAILLGTGIGIGVGQAAASWKKYMDLSTVGGANIRDELALVSQGQVTGALVDAILDTVGVFLDVYGARAGQAGVKLTRAAVEAAEKGLKEKVAEEASKRALRGAAKETGITAAGAAVAIAQEELFGKDEEPQFEGGWPGYDIDLPPDIDIPPEFQFPGPVSRMVIQLVPASGAAFELHIEGALRRNEIPGLPKMIAVIPGQYTGSGHGIDRIGISIDKADRITVWHFEMKFVEQGGTHKIVLGTPSAGTQTGLSSTQNAIDKLLDSNKPEARLAKERLRRAMGKLPEYQGVSITKAHMSEFLNARVPKAPTRIFVPNYADLSRLYKQVAALIRHGRRVRIKKL